MGQDIAQVILGFLNDDFDISELHDTFIMLIPKVKDLKRITEYQPISLCNMVNKLISKRLRGVLLDIIDDFQSSFVKEWLITDNAILSTNALLSMKMGRPQLTQDCMAIKLDMRNVYDRIEWSYLE